MQHSLDQLRVAIAPSIERYETSNQQTQAAVAAILRQGESGPEVLFIQRSQREGDPWSGHIAFPGGRIESTDRSPQSAAERETHEELSFTLSANQCLGCLQPLIGVRVSISVSCFVYSINSNPSWDYSPEVAEAFWIPFSTLIHAQNQTTFRYASEEATQNFPAIRLRQDDRPLLWGITYRFIQEILTLAQPATPSSSDGSVDLS